MDGRKLRTLIGVLFVILLPATGAVINYVEYKSASGHLIRELVTLADIEKKETGGRDPDEYLVLYTNDGRAFEMRDFSSRFPIVMGLFENGYKEATVFHDETGDMHELKVGEYIIFNRHEKKRRSFGLILVCIIGFLIVSAWFIYELKKEDA